MIRHKRKLTCPSVVRLSGPHPHSLSAFLQGPGCERRSGTGIRISCGTYDPGPHPDAELCPGPSDPPEFRRFLDLRIGRSVNQAMCVQFSVPSPLRTSSVDRISPSLAPRIFSTAFSTINANGFSQDGPLRNQRTHSSSTTPSRSIIGRSILFAERVTEGDKGKGKGRRALSAE